MATTPQTNAKRSRNSLSTTSKNAGVPTRSKSARSKSVLSAIVKANADNAKKRVKPFSTDDGLIDYMDKVVMKAPAMPNALAIDTTKEGAELRREWCEKNGIAPVRAYDDGFTERRAGCPKNINGWRPENSIRSRIESVLPHLSLVMHYTRHDTNYYQYTHAMSLDWSNGQPDSYEGADMVYMYKVAPPKK